MIFQMVLCGRNEMKWRCICHQWNPERDLFFHIHQIVSHSNSFFYRGYNRKKHIFVAIAAAVAAATAAVVVVAVIVVINGGVLRPQ